MTTPLTLRDYQRDAIDRGIYEYFANNAGNPLIVIPTGGGKALVIGEFIRGALEQWPDQRVLVLTHVKELISQNYAELMGIWPDAPAGVNSAGLGSRDYRSKIIFGGIQSLHKHAYKLQRIDLVLVDEAHLIPRSANTMYGKFLADLRTINPFIKIVGLTATPFKLNSGMLHKGDGAVFSDISYEISIRDLIDQKFLVPPRTITAKAQIDTSEVGTRLGEFIQPQLEAAACDPGVVGRIADEIVRRGEGRRGWLVFCVGVDHAKMMQDALQERGIVTGSVFGDTPSPERAAIIGAFKRSEIQCLTSMGVLTTGFNAQHVDLIALARPTKSTGLYIQMVGRGLRTYPDKTDCLILDFGGNIRRHGPMDDVRVGDERRGDGTGEAPTKTCPECECECALAARDCMACGFEFPEPVKKVEVKPEAREILLTEQQREAKKQIQWLDVRLVQYARHSKPGKPPSLRVEYHCGLSSHREWICFEHDGYPRAKAVAWWQRRAPEIPVPDSVDEALDNCASGMLKEPTQICVRPSGKYTEIAGMKLP